MTFGIYAANVAEGSESARVDWGDGQSSVVNAGEFSELLHTYAAPGDYEVFISDDIDSLTLQNGSSGVWAVDYPAMVVGAAVDRRGANLIYFTVSERKDNEADWSWSSRVRDRGRGCGWRSSGPS